MSWLYISLFLLVGMVVSYWIGTLLVKLFRSEEDKASLYAMLPLTAMLVGGYLWNHQRVLETAPGDLEEAIHLDDRRLLLNEKVTIGNENGDTTYARLTLVDLETGGRLARARVEGWLTCWLAAPERLICRSSDGFSVLDAGTLATVASREDLAKRNPALATKRNDAFGREGDRAVVTSDDGYRYAIDPTSLEAHRLDGEPPRPEPEPTIPGPRYWFDGQPRARLVVQAEGKKEVRGAATYLEPRLVERLDLDGDALVYSKTSLDAEANRMRMTRVGPAAEERWTLEDLPGEPRARRQGNQLVIVVPTRNDGTYVLVIDAATGKVVRRIVP